MRKAFHEMPLSQAFNYKGSFKLVGLQNTSNVSCFYGLKFLTKQQIIIVANIAYGEKVQNFDSVKIILFASPMQSS